MPLIFPSNPSINQTYQSGSSAQYSWDGTKWTVVQPTSTTVVNARTATSASFSSIAVSASFSTTASRGITAALSTTASYAVTASILDNPIYFIENNAAANISVNTNGVSYVSCTRINPQTTGWDLRYFRGGFSISSNQLFVGRVGYWKITFSLTGQDAGANNTLLGAHIGLNGASVCQRYGSVISAAYYTLNLDTIVNITSVAHPIDFRVGTAGGEMFTINQYNLSLEFLGN